MTTGAADDPPPQPPVEPDLDLCCGQGCEPCVFDTWELLRERYRAELQAWRLRHPDEVPPADPG